ncbi:MAG: GNAT family N-acetyltransferase [Deltaproteobacteria bacterium]|nr:GNAT family N-acetyltransferase [Deltaproteobacteria bacterium]
MPPTSPPPPEPAGTLRPASPGDLALLVGHHVAMFREIWEQRGQALPPEREDALGQAYAAKLGAELTQGVCQAWLIEEGGQGIASGAVSWLSLTPNPLDLASRVGYLHSIYTAPAHRNRQCAQRLVQRLLEECRRQGVRRVLLHASPAGRPVYEKFGFASAPETMRLIMD